MFCTCCELSDKSKTERGESNVGVFPHSGCRAVTSHESSGQYHQDANSSLLLATQKDSKVAERIYGITCHISSSPYDSEDIHTNYTDITLEYYSKES